MLHACHHRRRVRQVGTLVSAHHGLGHTASQERILTVAFADSSPAAVVRDIHHWREGPAYTVCCCLRCRYLRRTGYCRRVPCAGQCQRNRKYRLIAVNHIHSEEQRNTHPTLFDRYALDLANESSTFEIKQAAHPTLTDVIAHITDTRLTRHDISGNRQVQLPQFLLQGHTGH